MEWSCKNSFSSAFSACHRVVIPLDDCVPTKNVARLATQRTFENVICFSASSYFSSQHTFVCRVSPLFFLSFDRGIF